MADTTYYITTLTFPHPLKLGSWSGDLAESTPFYRSSFSAKIASYSKTAIVDDDGEYEFTESGVDDPDYNYRHELTQRLGEDTTIGGVPYSAGQSISVYHGGLFEQLGPNGEKTGNFFRIHAPHTMKDFDADVMGDNSTVFLFAVERTDAEGNTYFPKFDTEANYKWVDNAPIYSVQPWIPYSSNAQLAAPTCFTTGTLIACDSGYRAIETLERDDLVCTRDNGMRRIRWIGSRTLDAADLDLNPAFRPIRIRAGALGNGLPEADLIVSPQHRVLVQSDLTRKLSGEWQVLVAAKHLTDMDGIDVVRDATTVTYWHMLFDGHELVRSNGAWTESLYAGPEAMKSLDNGAQREILRLFPELAQSDTCRNVPARPFVTGREGRRIARHHARTNASLIGAWD